MYRWINVSHDLLQIITTSLTMKCRQSKDKQDFQDKDNNTIDYVNYYFINIILSQECVFLEIYNFEIQNVPVIKLLSSINCYLVCLLFDRICRKETPV